MKTPEEILIEKYGCSDLADLQKCFLNDMISFSMIRESMEEYGKQQYNQALKEFSENLVVCSKFSEFDKKLYCWSNKNELLNRLKKQ